MLKGQSFPAQLDPSAVRPRQKLDPAPVRSKKGVFMLYDSTKNLLQSILRSLETGDQTRWDDQRESGNACLYEMHQMSGARYKAYRSDSLRADSMGQSTLPEKLNRSIEI